MVQFFEKNKENPNFSPLCRNMNLPLKLNCIRFSRLNILSHMQKKFEKSNVEIVRRVVNRQSYERAIHSLDDLCVIYDIASKGSTPSSL